MEKRAFVITVPFALVLAAVLGSLVFFTGRIRAEEAVSGRLENGFRVISVAELGQSPDIRVFRGDYIKFEFKDGDGASFSVPALDIEAALPPRADTAPYFKMKQVGVYDYVLGEVNGSIRVVEYDGVYYQALTAIEARDIMESIRPLVLDVRTPAEFKAGKIEGATLLPVQVLQRNLPALSAYKEEPVLIYCATGNRSTVASKILIDNGFRRIFNLKKGIKDWQRQGLPVVRPSP